MVTIFAYAKANDDTYVTYPVKVFKSTTYLLEVIYPTDLYMQCSTYYTHIEMNPPLSTQKWHRIME